MTRYIDADELANELHKHFSKGFDGDEWWNSTHVLTAIEETPTVDAVPVEWIENYLRNYRYMAPIEKNFVREMIKAWEEREEE